MKLTEKGVFEEHRHFPDTLTSYQVDDCPLHVFSSTNQTLFGKNVLDNSNSNPNSVISVIIIAILFHESPLTPLDTYTFSPKKKKKRMKSKKD
jgi:hypothetical protein